MRSKLLREALMRAFGFRNHQQARCVLVDAVNNARPLDAANAREIVGMCEQRVDKRAVPIARGRMNDEAYGLVDDNQILIFEDDI